MVAVRCHLCAGMLTTGSPHLQLVAAGKRQGYWTTVDSFSLVSDLGNSGSEATAKGSIHRLALGESDRAIPLQDVSPL